MYPSNSPAERKKRRDRFDERHPGWMKQYARNRHLKKKYGITNVEWDALFVAQNRRCAICKSSEPKGRYWHTDHAGSLPCTKKQVRGILCMHCNHVIGKGLRTDAIRLRRQMQFVEHFL
jgi:hypothetical protein